MNDNQEISKDERQALDQLGENFDALLARTPEHESRSFGRKFALAGVAAIIGVLALVSWAVWPSDSRISVDNALASIADVAAEQPAPGPGQLVESESLVTTLAKRVSGSKAPPGVERGGFFTVNVSRRARLGMTLPGAIQSRVFAEGPGGSRMSMTTSRTRPLPSYRIGGENYRPSEIDALVENPGELTRRIDKAVREVPPAYRDETKWQYLTDPLKAISPPLPPSIRSELISGLETIPGVAKPTDRRDPRGRDGLEFTLAAHGLEYDAIFDPHDSQLLSTATTVRRIGSGPFPDSVTGQIVASYLLISSRIVNATP